MGLFVEGRIHLDGRGKINNAKLWNRPWEYLVWF
jgi:hypothetical protein